MLVQTWITVYWDSPWSGVSFVNGEEFREDVHVQRGSCEVPELEYVLFARKTGWDSLIHCDLLVVIWLIAEVSIWLIYGWYTVDIWLIVVS